ncbi:hypothetical protein [Hymenobacter sp. NBH84]|nr:hypothetical protein [Hymenobacter sp. NBH84]
MKSYLLLPMMEQPPTRVWAEALAAATTVGGERVGVQGGRVGGRSV